MINFRDEPYNCRLHLSRNEIDWNTQYCDFVSNSYKTFLVGFSYSIGRGITMPFSPSWAGFSSCYSALATLLGRFMPDIMALS